MRQQDRTKQSTRSDNQQRGSTRAKEGWLLVGVIAMLLLASSLWLGPGAQVFGTGLDVDVPAPPTEESEPTD